MGWFSKKDMKNSNQVTTLPDLPPVPRRQEEILLERHNDMNKLSDPVVPNVGNMEISSLPELPEHKTVQEIQDPVVKEALSEPVVPIEYTQEMQPSRFAPLPPREDLIISQANTHSPEPKLPSNFNTSMKFKEIKKEVKRPEIISRPKENIIERSVIKNEPIFVRLDKFEVTSQSLDEIKDRVHEIERYLEKTRDIKRQEEKELNEWEKDLEIIKAKLDSIDNSLFKDLE